MSVFHTINYLVLMVCPAWFEHATFGLGNQHSIQLNYGHSLVAVPGRIELPFAGWKPAVLTDRRRDLVVAGVKGLEPSTYRVTGDRSNQLSYTPIWWRIQGSNLLPPECKSGALPDELIPQIYQTYQNNHYYQKSQHSVCLESCVSGAPCPSRTDHLLITNQLLYQMS